MKLRFLATGLLLVLGLGAVHADGLKVGGYTIHTSYLGIQTFRTTSGVTDTSPVTVNQGPWWVFDQVGSRTQLNFSYDSDVVGFVTTFKLDEQLLGSVFNTADLTNINPLNTANITFKLMDGQVKLRTGLYQEEGLGFNLDAFASGTIGRYLASSHGGGTDSNYLTSVSYAPDEIPGLSVLIGVPIAPNALVYPTKADTNGAAIEYATNVYKRFRLTAKWDVPDVGLVHAYWYNALNSNKTSSGDAGFKINTAYEGMNEFMVGIENINFADAQWKFGYVMDNARGASVWSFQHAVTASSRWMPAAGLTILADSITTVFNKEWATTSSTFGMVNINTSDYSDGPQTIYASASAWPDAKLGLWEKVQVNATYDAKPFQYGLITSGVYEPFSNSHYYNWGQPSAGYVNSDVSQGWELIGVVNPYVKLLIGQGTITLGLNLIADAKSVGDTTNTSYGWQVPIDFFLWF